MNNYELVSPSHPSNPYLGTRNKVTMYYHMWGPSPKYTWSVPTRKRPTRIGNILQELAGMLRQ